jgi:hypothetical protein
MNGLDFMSDFVDGLVVRDSVEVRKWRHSYELQNLITSIHALIWSAGRELPK